MAEGILRNIDPALEVFSAGTKPEKKVNPFAVRVMEEIGIDISSHCPKHINDFTGFSFDYVITVCDNAKESCPVFTGTVSKRLHIGFPDPADAPGTGEEISAVYRKTRDEIKKEFEKFYNSSVAEKKI